MKNIISTRLPKIAQAVVITHLVLFATPVFSDNSMDLSDLEVGFLYYKVSKLPILWDHFANHYVEYRDARDEFQRVDAMGKIKPILEDMQNKVLNTSSYVMKVGGYLDEYDFGNGGFPTGINNTTYIPVPVSRSNMKGPDFAILFINGEKYSILKLSKEEARKRIVFLRDSRRVVFEIEFTPKTAREERLGYYMHRVISAEIIKIKVFSEKYGQLIGEIGSQ